MMIQKFTSFPLLVSRCLYIFAILFCSIQPSTLHAKAYTAKTKKHQISKKAKQNKKQKRTIPDPPFPLKPFSRMNESEITATVHYYETYKSSDKFTRIKALERLISICTNHHELEHALITLADLYYSYSNLEKAAQTYKKYVTLFPGTEKSEYALYKALICLFQSILDKQRDQTTTEKTIDTAIEFLEKTTNETYKQEARDILIVCYNRLAQHEAEIAQFYINSNDTDAAQQRIAYIKTKLQDKAPESNKIIADLEAALKNKIEPQKTTSRLSRKHKLLG